VHSFDLLVRDFVVISSLMHDVGTGSSGKWGVFMVSTPILLLWHVEQHGCMHACNEVA
jgi:hypothetical protein